MQGLSGEDLHGDLPPQREEYGLLVIALPVHTPSDETIARSEHATEGDEIEFGRPLEWISDDGSIGLDDSIIMEIRQPQDDPIHAREIEISPDAHGRIEDPESALEGGIGPAIHLAGSDVIRRDPVATGDVYLRVHIPGDKGRTVGVSRLAPDKLEIPFEAREDPEGESSCPRSGEPPGDLPPDALASRRASSLGERRDLGDRDGSRSSNPSGSGLRSPDGVGRALRSGDPPAGYVHVFKGA